MDQLRYDGQVAIVTGSGGQPPNLGATYAKLLAARGAKVVVNRLGRGPDGSGRLASCESSVVNEIVAAGGEAIADNHSVAEPDRARDVVQTALDAWGRVDILINNAGVLRMNLFDDFTDEDIVSIVGTHLYGHIWMARAVWPHMQKADYGRIVNITSEAAFGQGSRIAPYGAAKAGVIGLTNNLAKEARGSGIKVNTLSPVAATAKHPFLRSADAKAWLAGKEHEVGQVAQMVGYLCHETCKPSGGLFFAGKGSFREYRLCQSTGYHTEHTSVEDLAAHYADIAMGDAFIEHPMGTDTERFGAHPNRP